MICDQVYKNVVLPRLFQLSFEKFLFPDNWKAARVEADKNQSLPMSGGATEIY